MTAVPLELPSPTLISRPDMLQHPRQWAGQRSILAKRSQNIPRYFKVLMIPGIPSIRRAAQLFPSRSGNRPASSPASMTCASSASQAHV